ncbi:MAG: chemotaxis protein CheA [Anaerolineae bacterium]|nr:MAG: chemotaxis protein CheA [Anaerolineae bacterium]
MTFDTSEFLQDFLDESAELLASIQQNLMALESDETLATGGAQRALVHELFRAFHTLKGISGMVGLKAASDLSHALENVLDAVRKERLALTPEVVDRLLEGSEALEQAIAALTAQQDGDFDIRPYIQMLEALQQEEGGQALLEAAEAPPALDLTVEEEQEPLPISLPTELARELKPEEKQQLRQAAAQGRALALAVFAPSEEKRARRVNVSSVRQRFEEEGLLFKAIPLIEGRSVRFAFLLIADAPLRPADYPEVELTPLALPKAAQEQPTPTPRPTRSRSTTLRLDISRLDEILWQVGELVVTRSQLATLLPRLREVSPETRQALEDINQAFERQLRYLRAAVMRARLVPLSEAFGRIPLIVRDLARDGHKQIDLQLSGEQTELDKALVEGLSEPLLHLVRNAIAHGLETPQERQAAGKPPVGRLTVGGEPEGEFIHIWVSDDGRGLNLQKIARLAAERGWVEADEQITPQQALDFICRPGFSTRSEADQAAGRGVGMEVVLQGVRRLGGDLTVDTKPGQGTTFHIRIPLTLTILQAILLQVADERYAVPRNAVQRVVEIPEEQVVFAEGSEMMPLNGEPTPILPLRALLGLPPAPDGSRRIGLVAEGMEGRLLLAADRVLGMQEVVMHSLEDPLATQEGLAGATELGDGNVVLILDVAALYRLARRRIARNQGFKP